MKILIVEDDIYKAEALVEYLEHEFHNVDVKLKDSLSSGVFEIMDNPDFDLVLLDMSMPSFDATNKDPRGGDPESFAGEDFLSNMDLMGIDIPVIVVTQFETFERDDDVIPLEKLTNRLQEEYRGIFLGCVYFKSISDDWKRKLSKLIRKNIK